jgi:phosphohistidine phosphatase
MEWKSRMKLTIIRHGIAVPSGTPGISDGERPLTRKGRRRFQDVARGLAEICERPDVLLTSPLPRAVETAEIAGEAWGGITPTSEAVLAEGGVDQILAVLAQHAPDQHVAIVGHEPTLSSLLARLLGSGATERFAFRKGGVAHLDVPGALPEGGRLEWFTRPRILRALG